MRTIRELEEGWGPFKVYAHADWRGEFPWLVQGCTGRAARDAAGADEGEIRRTLAHAAGIGRIVRPRQQHGAEVLVVRNADAAGDDDRPAADALATAERGVGLVVLVADCVPVFLVDPGRRAVGVVHAGWRGTAAGVLEAAVARMRSDLESRPADLRLHFGPAICGDCYEVGAEVFEALRHVPPGARGFVDLAEILDARARSLGVPAGHVTRSIYCTRCDGDRFYSYRAEGARAGRMAAWIGLRQMARAVDFSGRPRIL